MQHLQRRRLQQQKKPLLKSRRPLLRNQRLRRHQLKPQKNQLLRNLRPKSLQLRNQQQKSPLLRNQQQKNLQHLRKMAKPLRSQHLRKMDILRKNQKKNQRKNPADHPRLRPKRGKLLRPRRPSGAACEARRPREPQQLNTSDGTAAPPPLAGRCACRGTVLAVSLCVGREPTKTPYYGSLGSSSAASISTRSLVDPSYLCVRLM